MMVEARNLLIEMGLIIEIVQIDTVSRILSQYNDLYIKDGKEEIALLLAQILHVIKLFNALAYYV